jgi:hypothetical protein
MFFERSADYQRKNADQLKTLAEAGSARPGLKIENKEII